MARKRRLPAGGKNLFQEIKEKKKKAIAAGKEIINLAIGQPGGAAFLVARQEASKVVLLDQENVHEYQDNGSPGVDNFPTRFNAVHVSKDPAVAKAIMAREDVISLPTPGSKSMLGLVILAQGKWAGNPVRVATVTEPGYPTPGTWCQYLETPFYALHTNPNNKFLPEPGEILEGTTLLHLNLPHNPSGAYATKEYWEEMCTICEKHNIRIFNDGAYSLLWHNPQCCTLAEVAVNFPNLSWAEAYSVSKAIGNGTGWRVGGMVGSPDFIADIAEIKGNTDSGFFAPAAAGAIHCLETDMASVIANRETYKTRTENLISVLVNRGMDLATEPGAGFFTLWKAPQEAFGQPIANGKAFNWAMIEETGLTGVHFGPYWRGAVVENLDGNMLDKIDWAAKKANPVYK